MARIASSGRSRGRLILATSLERDPVGLEHDLAAEVDERVAALSTEELHQLRQHID